jgi:hypothetical protein
MDIPNWLLNLTNKIIHESQKMEIPAVNSRPVVWNGAEQMKSPWGSQSVHRKTARAEKSERTGFCGRGERYGTMLKGIPGFL